MAKRNYLVEGLSGAGKSSVYEELIQRGYKAISTDRAWKTQVEPGTFEWNEQKALGELQSSQPDVLFVCGSSSNRDRFLPYFSKVFNLRIDDDTMRRRLRERTNNDFGKEPEELELMLRLNRSGERPTGAIDVDATRPLDEVVDELLRLAGCETVNDDATPTPWSKSASVTGQAVVISESALPAALSDHFWDALAREAITRIEYSWSGDVLTTLLSYLDEQGIDLVHSCHDAVTATGGGSVFVLTSQHRERYSARLDPSLFDGAALRRYYEDVNGIAAEGVEYAMLDGVAFLRDTLAPLEPAIVAVLVIGDCG